MKCADCGKMFHGIKGLMPRPAGKVGGTVGMPKYDMVCGCSKSVPIDQTSKSAEEIPPPDDYPF